MQRRLRASAAATVAVGLLAGCIRFGAPTAHPVPLADTETIRDVLVGDVTGDGRDDLLVDVQTPQYASRRTQVMVGCGAGCTTPGESIPGWRPTTIADLDGDGIDDVIVTSVAFYQGAARLYFGGAAGGGRPAGLAGDDWVALPNSWSYATADVDGDGDLDLVQTTTFMTYYLEHRLLRNDGTGGFTDGGILTYSGPLNAGGGGVLIVGDGTRDRLYPRSLGGWMVATPTFPTTPSNVPSEAFGAVDVDGDGIDDLIASTADDRVTFFRGTGSGFTPFPDYQTIVVPSITGWHVGDIDGDGFTDLWIHDSYAGATTMLGGSGDGGFPYEPDGAVPPGRLAFGDLDGDQRPEAIGISADSRSLVIHPNAA